MTPIPDKHDFAFYATKYFYNTGNAVEVGAFEGEFAKLNMRHWPGQYFLVDTWGWREDDFNNELNDKNFASEMQWKKVMVKVRNNVAPFGDRVVLLKGTSVDMAANLADEVFDWVFIDAGHDYENCKKDLNAWWPKLRKGGLFSGDDYGISKDVRELYPATALRYANKYSGVARDWLWGTAEALNEFCEEHKQELHITWLNDKQTVPNWYLIKK